MERDTPNTQMILNYLSNNSGYVERYLQFCRQRGVLPSCSDFLRVSNIDWSMYRYSRKEVTDYLRKLFVAMR